MRSRDDRQWAAVLVALSGLLFGCLELGSSWQATDGESTEESTGEPTEEPLLTCDDVACAQVLHVDSSSSGPCALLENGEIRCWGNGDDFPLGTGQPGILGDDEVPGDQAHVDVGGKAVQVAGHCALLEDGAVRCWGRGVYGALGYGDREDIGDDESPASRPPVDVGFPVVELASGYSHVCARSAAGEVRCWGSDLGGVLGRGVSASLDCIEGEYETFSCAVHPACCVGDDEPPSSIPPLDLGGPATQISGTCALLESGLVRCWGKNDRGQLGLGHTQNIGDDEVPASAEPISLGGPALQISSSGSRSCALLVGGDVRCWGVGVYGVLGHGNEDDIGDDELPSDVDPVSLGGPAVDVAVGYQAVCALRADGALFCWGRGDWGPLGFGNLENIGDDELPSDVGPIDLGLPVRQVSPGFTTCAVLDDGLVRCWGAGLRGELGNGQTGACSSADECSAGPECCLGDSPGEMPPPPVVLF